jgi:pSer/pThr/pTyr-binding forkhead associated (FHA) protein
VAAMGQENSTPSAASATLHLLDSAQGHPIQTWRFNDCHRITIGRLPENHVCIVDPQVSRLHTEFAFADGNWKLVSHGRNGTRIRGESVIEVCVTDAIVFQLGASGPLLKFIARQEAVSHMATISPVNDDPIGLDFLVVDQQKKQSEVQQIAEADSFKLLQQQARELKQRRKLEETETKTTEE